MSQVGGMREVVARRSVCFCSQSGGGASIGLHNSCSSHVTEEGGLSGFLRLALKVDKQNDGDFVDVILL